MLLYVKEKNYKLSCCLDLFHIIVILLLFR
jgi:hypothetical protein